MKQILKNFSPIFKILLLIYVFYYLINKVSFDFIDKVYEYYFIIFMLIPLIFIKILINSFKISYLLKILNRNKVKLRKIFDVLFTAQLSTAFPASFITSKTWIDTNLIKTFKLSFKEYVNFNFLIFIFSFLTFLFLYFFNNFSNLILYVYSSFFFILLLTKKYRNFSLYFFLFILNLMINFSISYIIIYFVNSPILEGNTLNILFSTIISNYLNLFSLLPFNIGYSQVVYSISFDLFSLPKDLALTISTIKQITQIIMVFIVFVYISKRNNSI